jgi:hypothetical protein
MYYIIHEVIGFHYTKASDDIQFTVQIRLLQMHTVYYTGPSSFIPSVKHYKNGFKEKEDTFRQTHSTGTDFR